MSITTCLASRTRLTCLAIAASLVAISAPLGAQDSACPRPALARLSPVVGQWTVSWRTRVNDSLVTATDGRSTIAWAAGRCALTEDFSARLPSGPSAQHRLFAVSGDSLTMTYLDSEHGEPLAFFAPRAPASRPK